jgi:hypothetical protein
MTHRNRSALLALCIAILALAGCASEPRMDGGIVGTGNRTDCPAAAEECRPERRNLWQGY